MIKRKALAAALSGIAAGILVLAATGPAPSEEAPPLRGIFAHNFTLLHPPVPAPLAAFQDLDGRRVRLADFTGQVVLLNFWATWCAPCVREMPSLDRLQAELGDNGLTIVAVSLDRGGVEVIEPFAKRLGLKTLGLYLDPKNTLATAFAITGLPTTFLIDSEGRIVGALQGPAEWDSPEAVALVRYYLQRLPNTSRQSAGGN